jgi:hypothetical protein
MLEKEFQYYLDNQEDLVRRYPNRFLVIRGNEVVGDYGSHKEAYHEATQKYALGTFLIQQCSPGKESYTQVFHTRAIINPRP